MKEIQAEDFDYFPNFIEPLDANSLFNDLLASIEWETETIRMFGKSIQVPRLIKWIGDAGINYSYSGVHHIAHPWPDSLLGLRRALHQKLDVKFNGLLMNLYQHGDHYMGWHADDEKTLGNQPTIASISLGSERKFQFREKHNGSKIHNLILENGSLLVMKNDFQTKYKHQLPKSASCNSPRINLTFRKILIQETKTFSSS